MFGHAPASSLYVITFSDKFKGTVRGTFQPDSNTQQSTDPIRENITTVHSVSLTTAVESTIEVSIFAVGGTLFYVLIGVGGGAIVLIFNFIIICVLIGFSIRRKRKSRTFTIAATQHPHNGIQMQGRIFLHNNNSTIHFMHRF
jgi:hypothetical protein